MPWLLGRRTRRAVGERDDKPLTPWQTSVRQPRCHACTQCVQDCPFDAVKMVPRTDGKAAFDSRAWVDPDRCTGCGECVVACPYSAMGYDEEDHHAVKCDLCGFRPEGPACIIACPHKALYLVTEESLAPGMNRTHDLSDMKRVLYRCATSSALTYT